MDFSLTKEQEQLRLKARDFALEHILPIVHKYDDIGVTPVHVIEKAWKAGLMNLDVPKKYGGMEYGLLESALVVEEFAAAGPGMATSIFANGLGEEPLLMSNNDALKEEICKDLVQKFGLISFATSEPVMGSDVGGMICKAEKDGDEWVLNGTKYWITNAGLAKYISLFAKIAGLVFPIHPWNYILSN